MSGSGQNRTLRFLVEAGAIFLGVSLGFLADDYRDHLNDRRLEIESLGQLLQDLELDSADVEPMIGQPRVLIWASHSIVGASARGTPHGDSLGLLVDSLNVTGVYTYEPSASAYAGIKSTGRIDLIADPDVKRAVVFYFEDRQAAVGAINLQWQDGNRRFWDAVGPHLAPLESDPFQGFPDWSVRDPTVFFSDPEVLFRAGELMGFSNDMLDYATELLETNREVRTQVETYLANR